jgi:hypothetical protein
VTLLALEKRLATISIEVKGFGCVKAARTEIKVV